MADDAVISQIFKKLTELEVMLSKFTGIQEVKEKNCDQHQERTKELDVRVRALELVASSAKGSDKTSHNWRDTLIQCFTLAVTVAATVFAMRSAF